MNSTSEEKLKQQLAWLDPWFENIATITYPFTDSQQQVWQELTRSWSTSDKITLLNTLKERFGSAVVEVLETVIAENARREWAKVADQCKSTAIPDLVRLLWEPLRELGFEFTVEQQENSIQIYCTRCPHYELGKAIGATDWLYHLVCVVDPYMVEGFNPQIRFRRTKTLMEGQAYCDHFYFSKE